LKNKLRAETLGAEGLATLTATEAQIRPPLPVEPEMSITGASQIPIVEGAEIDTIGLMALAGADNVTVAFVAVTKSQDSHTIGDSLAGHRAPKREVDFLPARLIVCPSLTRPAAEEAAGITEMVLASTHWHFEYAAPENTKILSHEKEFGKPALFVGESKETTNDEPSGLNKALRTLGRGGCSLALII